MSGRAGAEDGRRFRQRRQRRKPDRWRGAVEGPGRGRGEDGASTIWVIATMGLVLLTGLVGVFVGAACLARHRADVAADLAALAGAARATVGRTDGCARAAAVAAANGGTLTSCAVIGTDVLVVVSVPPSGLPGRFGVAQGRARAGPVDTVPVRSG